ncbi:hypothetical protein [Microcoleus asticus]|uniref:Uncharacterized protein n=1 Tax=Microcoleus asticus IPMA8 TaxID=2563858 RepID=A0ABX2CR75_9CYAN|nr:hypothetical protein [Microcoleus asticus]NQE32881.1 hypothetical protein [Microcoleus asticus IPMA8]
MNPLFFAKDLGTRLITLTWQQLQAVWTHSRHCDLVATGAVVDRAIGLSTSRPYIIFLSDRSSYYQGRVDLGFILWQLLCSEKCLAVFTRDALTAADLNLQGLKKAQFVGAIANSDISSHTLQQQGNLVNSLHINQLPRFKSYAFIAPKQAINCCGMRRSRICQVEFLLLRSRFPNA